MPEVGLGHSAQFPRAGRCLPCSCGVTAIGSSRLDRHGEHVYIAVSDFDDVTDANGGDLTPLDARLDAGAATVASFSEGRDRVQKVGKTIFGRRAGIDARNDGEGVGFRVECTGHEEALSPLASPLPSVARVIHADGRHSSLASLRHGQRWGFHCLIATS